MPGKSLTAIPSNPHRPFRVGSLLIVKKFKNVGHLGMCRFIIKTVKQVLL